jgi:hypothetical protein
MAAPQLTVYADGVGAVSGDGLNTMCQTADTLAQLRSFIGIAGLQVYVRGQNAPNDGAEGMFYWNSGATGLDDNYNTIIPSGAATGGWSRLGFAAAWTPTDASVAALTLASAQTYYIRSGQMVLIGARIVYPVTADTHAAQIGGVPLVPAFNTGGGSPSFFTGGLTITLQVVAPNLIDIWSTSGVAITNAQMSGVTLHFVLPYFTVL